MTNLSNGTGSTGNQDQVALHTLHVEEHSGRRPRRILGVRSGQWPSRASEMTTPNQSSAADTGVQQFRNTQRSILGRTDMSIPVVSALQFLNECSHTPFTDANSRCNDKDELLDEKRDTRVVGSGSIPTVIQIALPSIENLARFDMKGESSLRSTGRGLSSWPLTSATFSARTLQLEDQSIDSSTLDHRDTLVIHMENSLPLIRSLIYPTGFVRSPNQRRVVESQDDRLDNDRLTRHVEESVQRCHSSVWFWRRQRLCFRHLDLALHHLEPLCNAVSHTTIGSNLTSLSLAGNVQLGSVPDRLVMGLCGLVSLDLTSCNLRELPSNWNLPNLTILRLGHNRLTEFPDECVFVRSPNLQTLVLYGNQITELVIPSSSSLSNLQSLDLGYNDLAWLPSDAFCQLHSLRRLDVTNNMLTRIPRDICLMPNLRRIAASSNPLLEPPIDVCDAGVAAMRRYWMNETSVGGRLRWASILRKEQRNPKRDLSAPLSITEEFDHSFVAEAASKLAR